MPAIAAPYPKRFYVEPHGRGFRARWLNDPAGTEPKRGGEPFATEDEARLFVALATCHGLPTALTVVRGEAGGAPATSHVASVDTALGFRKLAETYSQQRTKAGARTRADDLRLLHRHAVAYFGDTDITLITQKASTQGTSVNGPDGLAMSASSFLNWLALREGLNAAGKSSGKRLSPKTVLNIVILATSVFQYAVDEENPRIARNPFYRIGMPPRQAVERPHLAQEEYLALEKAMDPHFLPLLAFLVGTGVRWGEVAGLQIHHLHLDAETPSVDIRVACRKGTNGGRTLGQLKSKASRRTIALSARTVQLLRPLLEGRGPLERVFTMRGGGNLHHGNFRDRFFMPAICAAGDMVPAGFTIHGLRHTHAAWLMNNTMSMYRIMRRMGHADMATTERYYGHLLKTPDDKALAIIDQMSTGKPVLTASPRSVLDGSPAPYLTADHDAHLERAGGRTVGIEDELPQLEDDDVQE